MFVNKRSLTSFQENIQSGWYVADSGEDEGGAGFSKVTQLYKCCICFLYFVLNKANNSCSTWYDLVSPVHFFYFFYFSLSSHLQLTFTGFFHKDGKHMLIFTKYLCFVYFPMKEMCQKFLQYSAVWNLVLLWHMLNNHIDRNDKSSHSEARQKNLFFFFFVPTYCYAVLQLHVG